MKDEFEDEDDEARQPTTEELIEAAAAGMRQTEKDLEILRKSLPPTSGTRRVVKRILERLRRTRRRTLP